MKKSRRPRLFSNLILLFVDFFHNDCGFGYQGCHCADGNQHGRHCRTDHPDGERKFNQDAAGLFLDDDTPDIAFAYKLFYLG
jgi:hypothetical protein